MNFRKIKHLFRAAAKNKLALATNITGLSIGLAATILLMVFILHEWSYDKHFTHSDRIHRLHSVWFSEGSPMVTATNVRSAFTEIPGRVAGIDAAVQLYQYGSVELKHENTRFTNNRLLYADSTFFRIFDFKVMEGNANRSLYSPRSVVLTKSLAKKIYGNRSAVGETVEMGGKNFTVTAVVEDVPINTHFTFDLLMPMAAVDYLAQLRGMEFFTYFLLNPNADKAAVLQAINKENKKLLDEEFKQYGQEFSSESQPLERLHLHSRASSELGTRGSVQTLLVVGVIAFLVLFLALTNFVNLFIVEGEQRAREIGVRKVNGAGKSGIARQFFAEASFIVTVSFITGLVLAVILLPQFSNLMQRRFSWELMLTPSLIAALLIVYVLTIILSGSYPAFYLSRLNLIAVFKPGNGKNNRKRYIMNMVSGFQLVVTLFLITVLFGINSQIHYLKNLSPGFNPDGLVNVFNLNDNIKQHYPAIREKLLEIPEISGVSASTHMIGGGTSGQGIRLAGSPKESTISIKEYRIHAGLCELLQLNLKEGRFFDPQRENDRQCVILNEAAVGELGLTSAVDRKVVVFDEPVEIIGVVKDFRYETAANVVQPLMMTTYSPDMNTILIRTIPQADIPSTIRKVEQVMRSFDDGYIISSNQTRDVYDHYYAGEEKLARLTQTGGFLSLIIVMMGIFLMVSQSIARRTKEIGVRKVLGGSTTRMLALIYSNSIKWTFIAALIAGPLSYLYLRNWLQDYAVKTSIPWWLFLAGVIIILLLETLITLGQTWRAANRNPVESLRYE